MADISSNSKDELVPICLLQKQILDLYKNALSSEYIHQNQNRLNVIQRVMAYSQHYRFKFDESFSLEKIKALFKKLAQIQPVFRTIFVRDQDQYLLKVLDREDPRIDAFIMCVDDASGFDPEMRDQTLNPFESPMSRVTIFAQSKLAHVEFSHAIADGRSVEILQRQIIGLLENDRNLEEINRTPSGTYQSFAKRFNSKYLINKSRIEGFWKKLLKTPKALEENHLITDHSATLHNANFEAKTIHRRVNFLAEKIRECCHKFGDGVTPFHLLCYTLARVLRHRIADFDVPFCLGIAKDMRDWQSLRSNLVGHFVNTLPIPFDFGDGSKPLNKSIEDVKDLIDSVLKTGNSQIPYADLLNFLKVNSLFDVNLVQDALPEDNFSLSLNQNSQSPVKITSNKVPPKFTKFPMTVFYRLSGNAFVIRVEYINKMFNESTIQALIDEWIKLLRKLVLADEADLKSEDKCIMSSDLWVFDQNGLFGATQTSFDQKQLFNGMDIEDLLLLHAQDRPNEAALQTPNNSITNGQLWGMLVEMAREIRHEFNEIFGKNPAANTLIAVFGRRNSMESVILILSVILAGGAYLPIDTKNNPPKRIQKLLNDVDVKFCIGSTGSPLDGIHFSDPRKFRKIMQKVLSEEKFKLREILWEKSLPTSMAYVLYTSGTTGTPKAVPITRRALLNTIADLTNFVDIQTSDCVYQFTNFSFDISVLEIFGALLNGAKLFIDDVNFSEPENSSETKFFCPKKFAFQIDNHQITHAFLLPTLVGNLRDSHLKALSKLRFWVVGGEKLPQSLMYKALRLGVNVAQIYGPTETSCYCSRRQMRIGDNAQNLGLPVENMRVTVRTPNGEVATPFSPHQLFVAGPGITSRYLNRNEEGQSAFHWFDGIRYYATGDIVQRLLNGELLFIRRIQNYLGDSVQVKIRGVRIETGEIEQVLCQVPEVKGVKVIPSQNRSDLIAYVVPEQKSKINAESLREFCRENLNHFAVPRHFVILDEFPLTPNAKIDVQKLSTPNLKQIVPSAEEKEKNNATCGMDLIQRKIAQLFWTALDFGEENDPFENPNWLNYNFVYLGGNSLSAQRLLNGLSEEFGDAECGISMGDLLYSECTMAEAMEKVVRSRSSFNF